MTQIDKAKAFAAMHSQDDPVVLYNIWDAGSAAAVVQAGAKAVATGSWSVAAAQGYGDGEEIPLDFLLRIAGRIVDTVDVPVSIDFEGGYAEAPEALGDTIRKLLATGATGLNFEDRVVQGKGLYPLDQQVKRVAAIRKAADDEGIPLFLNARTDLFLSNKPDVHSDFIDEAIARGRAYADAGADGFFVPALAAPDLIQQVTAQISLPVNVMIRGGITSIAQIEGLGASRYSFGPGPFATAMEDLKTRFQAI